MKKIDAINVLYPTPTVLLGSVVEGRPTFEAVAHVGILNASKPHLVSMSSNKARYTNRGIIENGQFAVNIPGEGQEAQTDYCGIVSGNAADKSTVFEVFYGALDKSPLIAACPLAMACRLRDTYDAGTHHIFIGEVIETWAREDVLADGVPDLARVRPLLFDMFSRQYWSVGRPLARCWDVGKTLK